MNRHIGILSAMFSHNVKGYFRKGKPVAAHTRRGGHRDNAADAARHQAAKQAADAPVIREAEAYGYRASMIRTEDRRVKWEVVDDFAGDRSAIAEGVADTPSRATHAAKIAMIRLDAESSREDRSGESS